MKKNIKEIRERIAKAKAKGKVVKVLEGSKDLFSPIKITNFYYLFECNWFDKLNKRCCKCGGDDPVFVLELVSVEGSANKMDLVCSRCLFKSGYERMPGRSHWVWKKKK